MVNDSLSQESLHYCVSMASEMEACYVSQHAPGDNPRRSVDLLLETVSRYRGMPVKVSRSSEKKEDTTVWAATVAYEDRYEIIYVSGLDASWRRFVVCKEAFQIVLDQEKYRNMELAEHIKDTLGIINMPTLTIPSDSVKSELMAEISAMQFLLPYKHRVAELNGANKNNPLAIADKYKVPQKYVEIYLNAQFMTALEPYSPGAGGA